MSEFGMHMRSNTNTNVDWYTPPAGTSYGNYGGAASYSAAAPAYGAAGTSSYSSAADNFEDEPPLLEGMLFSEPYQGMAAKRRRRSHRPRQHIAP